ncbi:MAG: phosphoribosylamine--glycine ligase [Hyphomicrobiaceae bacterium]
MNVLILGGGGREHALAWSVSTSPLLSKLYCAPGNAGIAEVATCVDLDVAHHSVVIEFCNAHSISFVIVGPEAPLVEGIVDSLQAAGIKSFGPSKAAAQLEGSKGFAKDFCREFSIPTADYVRLDNREEATKHLAERRLPIVIKADGLAAGKGVVIATTHEQAQSAVDDCFAGAFGKAGQSIVLEDYLEGEEASFFALVDGTTALALATAQDYKRVGDGDTGPNTGGMGACSPAPIMTPNICQNVMDTIITPTVEGMVQRGTPFTGLLYAGLMITRSGPQLIEYNVRFGDPECQVLMVRLKSDLLAALIATCDGVLGTFDLRWLEDVATTVVMAAKGYPESPQSGTPILGLDNIDDPHVSVFHAGTRTQDGQIIAAGGRVLNVTARAPTFAEAQTRAYLAIENINWPGGFCRRDIGWRTIDFETRGS